MTSLSVREGDPGWAQKIPRAEPCFGVRLARGGWGRVSSAVTYCKGATGRHEQAGRHISQRHRFRSDRVLPEPG